MIAYPFHPEIIDQLKCANKNLRSIIKMLEEEDSSLDLVNQLEAIETIISDIKNSASAKLDLLLCKLDIMSAHWGDLFILLIEELKQKPSQKVIETKAKGRCLLYLNEVKQHIIDERLVNTSNAKQQELARHQLNRLAAIEREVTRHWEAAEAAKWLALAGEQPKD